jgi:hypothetical protein
MSKAHANYHKRMDEKKAQQPDSLPVPAQPSRASKGGKSRSEAETPNSSGAASQGQVKKAQDQQHSEVPSADPGQQDYDGSSRADD